jgi:mercuric ion binding protein
MWRLVQSAILVGTMTLSLVGLMGFAAETHRLQTITLHIDGMTCGACLKDVKAALAKVSGVSTVEFTVAKKWIFFSDYADVRALVTFEPEKAGVEALVKAVEAASSPLSMYKARVLEK